MEIKSQNGIAVLLLFDYRVMNLLKLILIPIVTLLSFSNNTLALKQKSDTLQAKPKIVRVSIIKELQADIESIIENPDFSSGLIGVLVQSLESGEFIFKTNESKNFIPASNMKLITTAAALNYLGKDFRYKTYLYLDGSIHKNGEFIGNIIIRGSGDPTISGSFVKDPTELLDNWVARLENAGIRSIRGNIIGDDNYFDSYYYSPGWLWDDMIYPYSAQISALSINDNKVDIEIFPGENVGELAKFVVQPENSYIQIINNIYTVQAGGITDITAYREPQTNVIELSGTVAFESSIKKIPQLVSVTIDNPTRYYLNLFKEALNRRSVRFKGALFDIDDWNERISYSELRPFDSIISPNLSEIIQQVNKMSLNLPSEMLVKTIGMETAGEGSTAKGIEQIKKFASKIGINLEKTSMVDGSGLSRYNLISPNHIVNLLMQMNRSADSLFFIQSLAVPGKKGSLNRRLTKTLAERNVFAKTGTMNNVSNLSGYVISRDDELFAFSIMMMNFTVPVSVAETVQDLICMRLSSFTRK